MLIGWDIEGY
uniref:Uncharacterized protein n=1 Tax=Lepeophtheirus salmonis TaxID=72036 RepID=A0A0K2TAM6_LEPSM